MSLLAALALLQGALPALAAPSNRPDNTWLAMAPLPERLEAPLLALAVNPADNTSVLAGSGSGSIFRSSDSGATWQSVARGLGRGVTTLQFSPYKPGLVYAGTRGDGLWRSADGGATWARQVGLPAATFRSLGFSKTTTLAGSDAGLFTSRDALTWSPIPALGGLSVDAIAVPAVSDPPRLLAGADGSRGNEALPLYTSPDGGVTWTPVKSLGSSTMVGTAAAGSVALAGGNRPLLVGTNTGAFLSADNGATWAQLSGLPAIDYSATAFTAAHADRFYIASDGGATENGGVWVTSNSGQDFRTLEPPVGSVTALALSADEQPVLYMATFRPLDHSVMLWSYHDTGGRPNPPAGGLAPAIGPAATGSAKAPAAVRFTWQRLARGPEAPYLALAVLSGVVLVFALGLQLRRRGD